MSFKRCLHVYSIIFLLFTCESKNFPNEIPAVSKCCPKGKQLTYKGDLNECVEYEGSVNTTYGYPWWLPEDVYFLSVDSLEPVSLYPEEGSHKLGVRYINTLPCEPPETIPFHEGVAFLSDGTLLIQNPNSNWTFPATSYCTDRVTFSSSFHSFLILLCPCDHVVCSRTRKCCQDGMLEIRTLDGSIQASCVRTETPFTNDTEDSEFTVHGFPKCSSGVYKKPVSAYQLREDGVLQAHSGDVYIPPHEYCTDYMNDDAYYVETILACLQPAAVDTTRALLYGILLCTGAVFLIATLLVYLVLPELRSKMPSYNLIAHVSCLLVGYICMAFVYFFYSSLDSTLCVIFAFLLQFSFLAAFFWLSVMCIDISWTFSGMRVPHGTTVLNSESKKFVYYSMYAWGGTSLVVISTAILEFVPQIPSTKFKPNFGVDRCWFKDSEAILLLFYGPMALLLFGNLLLFIYTAAKIMIARRNTAILSHEGSSRYEGRRHADDKHRFALYLKLFCLTGLTWMFEIISWLIRGPDSIWYVTDFINALRGFFIFIIFCCKKKVFTLLKTSLCNHKTQNKTSSSNRTHRSSITPSSREISSQRTNSFQLSQSLDNVE